MPSFVISLGSNCGDRKANINKAIELIRKDLIPDLKVSEIYETPCVGKAGNPYMNAVAKGNYSFPEEILSRHLKSIETQMGRNKECRLKGDVPIDIDIVMKNSLILKDWDYRQRFFKIGYEDLVLKESL